jgi:hypothetical protein
MIIGPLFRTHCPPASSEMMSLLPENHAVARWKHRAPEVSFWPELGSRAMQSMLVADEAYAGGWITVQEGRYRVLAVAES